MTKPKDEAVKIGRLIRVAPHVRDGKSTGRWLIDLPPRCTGGNRERHFVDTKTAAMKEANRLLREFQLRGVVQGYGPRLSGVTFSEVAKLWLAEQSDRVATDKKRPGSLESDAWWTKPLLAAFADSDVATIGKGEVVNYQKTRRAAGRAPRTVNHEVRLLLRILSWAKKGNLVDRLPEVEHLDVPRRRVRLPTVAEMASIVAHLRPSVALLVRFLAETGARKGETFNLRWSDLDRAAGLVMFQHDVKTDASNRDVPISTSLMDALFASRDEAMEKARKKAVEAGDDTGEVELPPWVFPGRGGKRMTDFDKALATAIKSAGVTRDDKPMHITPHMLRKFHATVQVLGGLSTEVLQDRIGHVRGSRMTSALYVNPQDEHRAAGIFELPVVTTTTG